METEKYQYEKDGQRAFYESFLPRVGSNLSMDDFLSDNNDGILNGNLLEFKQNITDLNPVLFQCLKYLSALRIKGKSIPANILIIDVNAKKLWRYSSDDYLAKIEVPYYGAASKNNKDFLGGPAKEALQYCNDLDAERVVTLLKENKYTKIHIDENCIVGWATRFYADVKGARKEDFIGDETGKHRIKGEIRRPVHFKDLIYPYTGETNVKFNYLMDKLNDTLQKKNLGAFYTPNLYAEKSLELVRKAIGRVPKGNDYIILDRCAGTGNLEANLSDEELTHCIVSTIEYYEYKVLQELLGPKVRHIIPPFESSDTFNVGLVNGADALSKEYIENTVIKQYVDNPKCSIIVFENPPYSETSSIEHQKKGEGKSSEWKKSFVMDEMKKDPKIKGTAYNDLGNLFIWSAFKYYLRQPTDSLIVYSPVKYWKAQNLINKKFIEGFAFNRRHFHTNIEACIMCALWGNEDVNISEFSINAYNISKNNELVEEGCLPIKRVYSSFSQKLYDKRSFPDDIDGGIYAEFDGKECGANRTSVRIRAITNKNIVGYLAVKGANFDNPDSSVHLLRIGAYDANGFYLRSDSFLDKLPMFCASRYISYNRSWTERARVMKSADKADKYKEAVKKGLLDPFLIKCLIFTCLEMQNHCRSLKGSDGIYYRNELCLDDTNGQTLASRAIAEAQLDDADKKVIAGWETILHWAKKCENYCPDTSYGLYQIFSDLDTSYVDETTGDTVWDNVELHSSLQAMKTLIREYYNTGIVPTLFEYEFLK